MTAKQELVRARIIAAAALYAAVFVTERFVLPPSLPYALHLALYVIPYLVVGYDVMQKAWGNFIHG